MMESYNGAEEFQVCWKLQREGSANLVVEDGNGNTVHRKCIEFADFPLLELWFTGNVILRPSDY